MDDTASADKQLQQAFTNHQLDRILSIVTNGAVDTNKRDVNHELQTPIMRACHIGASTAELTNILSHLLKRKPRINVQDASGKTALSHACIAERCSAIKLLIEYPDCDPNLLDVDGNSPLMYACRTGNERVIQCFISCCQDAKLHLRLDQSNYRGFTCLMVAESKGVLPIIRHLLPNNITPSRETINFPSSPLARAPITNMQSPWSRAHLPIANPPSIQQKYLTLGVKSTITTVLNTRNPKHETSHRDVARGSGGHRQHGGVRVGENDSSNDDDSGDNDDDDDENDQTEDHRSGNIQAGLKHRGGRRGSLSMPDLRTLTLVRARGSVVPEIVVTPSSTAEQMNFETTAELSFNARRPLSTLIARETSNSLPNLANESRLVGSARYLTVGTEDNRCTLKLSLPNLRQSSGKAKCIANRPKPHWRSK